MRRSWRCSMSRSWLLSCRRNGQLRPPRPLPSNNTFVLSDLAATLLSMDNRLLAMRLPFLDFSPTATRRGAMFFLLLAASMTSAHAATFPLPPEDESLIGKIQETRVQDGETLLDIARRYSVGLNDLQNANPGVDAWLPKVGERVIVPSQYLLPKAPRDGVVVFLPELRLYYYPPAKPGAQRVVITYPLGIGSEGRAIPLADTKVIEKKADPVWVVPESIRAEHAAEGESLPKLVPPGPDNPLGRYALRLGLSSYLIHSTNRPYSVGMRVSHGCLRMYPEDFEALFPQIPVGTPVHIIDQPYKVGWHNGALFLESHTPMTEAGHTPESNLTPMVAAITGVVSMRLDGRAWQRASEVATRRAGIPMEIYAPAPPTVAASGPVVALTPQDARWLVQVGVFRDASKTRQVTQLMRRMDLPLLASARGGGGPGRGRGGPGAARGGAGGAGEKTTKHAGIDNLLVPAARVEAHPVCAPN